jgi:hypothetical protein
MEYVRHEEATLNPNDVSDRPSDCHSPHHVIGVRLLSSIAFPFPSRRKLWPAKPASGVDTSGPISKGPVLLGPSMLASLYRMHSFGLSTFIPGGTYREAGSLVPGSRGMPR